jgi:hypothetical protein
MAKRPNVVPVIWIRVAIEKQNDIVSAVTIRPQKPKARARACGDRSSLKDAHVRDVAPLGIDWVS